MKASSGRGCEAGAVTAETAVVLPIVAVFAIGLAWLVSLGVVHARAVDAAREVARSVARGDSVQDGLALGRQVAPARSQFSVRQDDRTITVTVTAPVQGPGGLFDFLSGYEVRAEAVAAQEPKW